MNERCDFSWRNHGGVCDCDLPANHKGPHECAICKRRGDPATPEARASDEDDFVRHGTALHLRQDYVAKKGGSA